MKPVRSPVIPLKLIAIVLPEPLYSYVKEEQKLIEQNWGPRHAQRTPPHLTLIPPLSLTESEFNVVSQIASDVASRNKSFLLEVNGFGVFKPTVVFLKPNIPTELETLYKDLRSTVESQIPHSLRRYPDRPYHPHITLVHKDVSTDQFFEIWHYYKKNEVSFLVEIDHFCILDNAKTGWEIMKRFSLKGTSTNNS